MAKREDKRAYQGLTIWKSPVIDHLYRVSADASLSRQGGDYCASYVGDLDSSEVVAAYWGKYPPDIFAFELVKICRYYNQALLIPEAGGGGGDSVINTLKYMEEPYLNIYQNRSFSRYDDEDEVTLGWTTTKRSRDIMLGTLKRVIRDREILIYDAEFYNEAMTFGINKRTGKVEAGSGCRDDRVMAMAILVQVMEWDRAGYERRPSFVQTRIGKEDAYTAY